MKASPCKQMKPVPLKVPLVKLTKSPSNCVLCDSSSYLEKAPYRGTTEKYKQKVFIYGRCQDCGSLNNLSLKNLDYSNYATGQTISRIKVSRFIRLLRQLKIGKNCTLLDYGCGNGALVKALRRNSYQYTYGYEPFNNTYSKTITNGQRYDVVFLIHVFEHISDYSFFFSNLKKIVTPNSLIITIHPSSTRMPALNPNCPFQNYTIHAPFHLVVPSDKMTIKLFEKNDYKLKAHYPYDIQRSGLKDNNLVSSLLAKALGGTKESWLQASTLKKITAFWQHPWAFLDKMFLHTRDRLSSTFVFKVN